MVYSRPWTSFPGQLALLKSRGMVVSDETAALDYLQRVGYYRLSATRFKLFLLLATTRMLVTSICPNTQWHNRLAEHLEQFP